MSCCLPGTSRTKFSISNGSTARAVESSSFLFPGQRSYENSLAIRAAKHGRLRVICMKCPVCNSGNLLSSVLIDRLPVLCNELHADAASARRSETGRFDGCLCRDCGHFFNAAFDERKVRYTQSYDSSLDFSPRFVSFEDELARRLNASYDLAGKLIIDVGCGKGGFLRCVCSLSGARGVGFDKSFEQRSHNITGVRFVKNWFDET